MALPPSATCRSGLARRSARIRLESTSRAGAAHHGMEDFFATSEDSWLRNSIMVVGEFRRIRDDAEDSCPRRYKSGKCSVAALG